MAVGFSLFSYTRVNTAQAAAGINHQINFQGKLVNLNGTNVADGSYSVVFSIYSIPCPGPAACGGTVFWTETQSVTVTNGIFQVNLGSVTTLPASVDFNTDNIYLGIKVGADAEMTPRVQFTSVPQAFNSEKLGGLDKTGFIQNGTSQQATSNFNISGTGVATSLQAGSFDTTGATTLSVGTGNANALTISRTGVLTTVAGSLTVTQATTLSSTLALTGAPTAIATSSLIQVGAAIAGGNAAVSGGTYYGLNAPATGAGSAADFLNFQLNGVSKLSVTNTGAVTATSFAGAHSGDGSALTNLNGTNIATGTVANARLTNAGALTVTASTGLTGGGSVALGGTTTLSLANTTVVVASYGSASSVATFTVNAQGQLTTAASTAIVIAATQITSGNYVATLGALTGLTTTGNTGTGSTPTLAVAYGAATNNAAAGANTFTCPSGGSNLSGGGTTVTIGTSGTTCAALAVISNPTFSGLITAQASTTGLALTGTPAASATSSLIQVGAAIAGGNAAVSGGTYYGLNAPATGAGSAADFLNFQLNGVSKLSVTNTGAVTATSFAGAHSGDGSALTNLNGTNIATGTVANARLVNGGALTVTAGTGLSGGGSVFLGGSTTVNLANTTVVATSYGSASSVATFVVNGQGQLTTAASTVIAIAGSQITSGTVVVAQGGTGTGSFTQNGVLYGNTTGAIQATAAGTTGQCLVANTAAAPTFGTCGNGVTIVGTFDSQASAANGATISSGTIYLQSATASNPGLVNATTQTFGGNKTLSGTLLVNNTGVIKTTSTTAFQVQNAGGASIISVDTSLNRLGINATNPQYTLDVNGSTQISGTITLPSNFLANYTYRKQLTVSPTASAANYETKVTLDTASLIAAGKMKSDCSDSRFTTANGTTLLNFYLDSSTCNTGTTNYWLQIPSLSSGATYTVYFYYGYALATSGSSAAASVFHTVNPAVSPSLGVGNSNNSNGTVCTVTAYLAPATSSSVYCFGRGDSGEMGDGTTASINITEHTVSGITNATQVSNGQGFACAVLSTGAVKCWGLGTSGQLGNSASLSSTTPVTVTGISTATAITAGNTRACALLSGGTIQCWGVGTYGQLGNGGALSTNAPVTVSTITTATAVVANGAYGTCARLSNGTVQCWGYSLNGELGNGTGQFNSPVTQTGATSITSISASYGSFCGLQSTGSILCWGYGADGELGNSSTANSTVPVSVTGISTAVAVIGSLSNGGANGSYCAQLTGGGVSCWGYGFNGQIGNGLTANYTSPQTVSGVSAITIVPNGGGFCALQSVSGAATLYCWGYNSYGENLNGSSGGNTLSPTLASNFTTITTSASIRFDSSIDANTTSVIRGNMAVEPVILISGQSFDQTAGGGNHIFSVDTTSGQALIKAYANTTNTLQVQNASGANIFTVDTTNNLVVANTSLYANGDIARGQSVATASDAPAYTTNSTTNTLVDTITIPVTGNRLIAGFQWTGTMFNGSSGYPGNTAIVTLVCGNNTAISLGSATVVSYTPTSRTISITDTTTLTKCFGYSGTPSIQVYLASTSNTGNYTSNLSAQSIQLLYNTGAATVYNGIQLGIGNSTNQQSGDFNITGTGVVGGNLSVGSLTINGTPFSPASGLNLTCGASKVVTSVAVTNGLITGGTCSSGTYSDLAEQFNSTQKLLPGDIVAIDPINKEYVQKSESTYQQSTIGVVSTHPDTVLGADNPGYPIALAGRVPVKVSSENGIIEAGDYITSSSTPGVGMKATTSGAVIGKAMTSFDTADATNTNCGAYTCSTVIVFVNPSYYNPASAANMQGGGQDNFANIVVTGQADISNLNVSGVTKLASLTVSGDVAIGGKLNVAGAITVAGATSVIDITVGGHIITAGNAPTVTIMGAPGTNATVTIEGNDTSGTITITAGNSAVAATPTAPAVPGPIAGNMAGLSFHKAFGKRPRVIITPADAASAPLLVYPVDTSANGFIIGTTMSPSPRAVYTFTYFIVE